MSVVSQYSSPTEGSEGAAAVVAVLILPFNPVICVPSGILSFHYTVVVVLVDVVVLVLVDVVVLVDEEVLVVEVELDVEVVEVEVLVVEVEVEVVLVEVVEVEVPETVRANPYHWTPSYLSQALEVVL